MADWDKETDFQRMLQRLGLTSAALKSLWYSDARPVEVRFRKARAKEQPSRLDPSKFGGRAVDVGHCWAQEPWQRAFFLVSGSIPPDFAGREVALRVDVGAEAVAYRDGIPVQGLDANRDDLVLTVQARGKENFAYLVEAVSVTAFGKKSAAVLNRAEVCVFNPEIYALYYDLSVIHSLLRGLGEQDPWAGRLLYGANKAVDVWRDEFSLPDERTRARKTREVLAPLFEHRAASAWPEVYLAGHAHIDVAWLWPLEETVRKCSRTFSSVVRYLAEYPEFRFSQSQAALYKMTREHFPSLSRSIREQVAEGRWETVGGMWVECDCNMVGAEAFVRQFLYGKKFFAEEFGTDTKVCWLPDTFGFPASMPQILKKCGIDYFASAKIGWNLYTFFPYDTFHWKGIDGSSVLAHLLVSGNYNTRVFPDQLREAAVHFRQADRSPAFFLSFGYGDGGGGPTRGMIERCRRVKDLHGLPRARAASLEEFFRRVEQDSSDLPSYRGDLYLEIHRGTLTTQARTKRNNRKCELALRRLEILLSALRVLGAEFEFKKDLDALWETLLTLQFHDVLPGSSIGMVYEDAERMYGELFEKAGRMEMKAAKTLAAFLDVSPEGKPYLVFNFLSWDREGTVELPVEDDGKPYHALTAKGEPLACQDVIDAGGRRALLVEVDSVPPMGYTLIEVRPGESPLTRSDVRVQGARTLLTEVLKVRLDGEGRLESLVDRRFGNEVLKPGGKGNLLQLFSDMPVRWEAWDIDEDFERVGDALAASSVEILEAGPVRATLRATYEFGRSRLVQDVRVHSHLPWVEFETRADWRERRRLLKAAFPLAVDPPSATCEIQFGAFERPTSRNDLKERAQFECAAHRWVDLSMPDYGVSLLNDCKYGHDVREGLLRLSLLRGTTTPDPDADLGEHSFSYALYPHKGDWRRARTVRAGFEFNVPLAAYPLEPGRGQLPPSASFISVDADNVVVEVLKPSEDGEAVVVRAYEAHGEQARASFAFDAPVRQVQETNLLEQDAEEAPSGDTGFDAAFAPFEIKTFKVVFG